MSDTVRPDEVIPPRTGGPTGSGLAFGLQFKGLVIDAVRLLPNLVKLVTRLMKDPRVPRRSKLMVGGLVAYLVSPIDLVPDVIPGVGKVDDLLVSVFVINHLIDRAGEGVVLEHWDGPYDLLDLVRTVLDATGQLVPPPLRRWMERFSG